MEYAILSVSIMSSWRKSGSLSMQEYYIYILADKNMGLYIERNSSRLAQTLGIELIDKHNPRWQDLYLSLFS